MGDDAWPSTPSEIVGWEMGARTCLHATPMHHPCTKPLPQNSLSHPAENGLNPWAQVVGAGLRFSGIVGKRPFWAGRGPGGPAEVDALLDSAAYQKIADAEKA